MSILRRLFSGELYPSEQIVPHDADYRSVTRKISDEKDYFKSRLSPADNERLEEMDGLRLDMAGMDSYACFSYGFKLGALLMCETFMSDDGQELQD